MRSQEQVQHQNAKNSQYRDQQLLCFTSVYSNVTDNYSASVLIGDLICMQLNMGRIVNPSCLPLGSLAPLQTHHQHDIASVSVWCEQPAVGCVWGPLWMVAGDVSFAAFTPDHMSAMHNTATLIISDTFIVS